MRILLDERLPAELAEYLSGHDVRTVHQENWKGIENGQLLALAAGAFQVFLTIDRRLQYQQQVPPSLMVVTVRARANRIAALRPIVPNILETLKRQSPGTCIQVQQ